MMSRSVHRQELAGHCTNDGQVKGVGKTFEADSDSVFDEIKTLQTRPVDSTTPTSSGGKVSSRQEVFVSPPGSTKGHRADTPVYELGHLDFGDVVPGPALIIDATQTIFVNETWSATATSRHLLITR